MLTESRFVGQLESVPGYFEGDAGLLSMSVRDPGGDVIAGYQPTIKRAMWPLTKMAENALKGHEGLDTWGYRDYRGIPVFGAWSWLDEAGIGLATEIDLSKGVKTLYLDAHTNIWCLCWHYFSRSASHRNGGVAWRADTLPPAGTG